MPLFAKKEVEVVLCSPMVGRLTFEGEPAVKAKVERWIKWKDEEGETDTVYTDKEGKFDLPIKKEKVKLSPIAQFVMAQEIRVYYNDKEFVIWSIGKRSKVMFGELGGEPENFSCELTDEGVPHRLEDTLLYTSCKWDAIKPIKGN